MARTLTEQHSLAPYPGPLWQAKNVKVQEKERLHTLNCPDKTVIAYGSFCPINLQSKDGNIPKWHLACVLRITAILHECGWRKQLFPFLPGKMSGNSTEVIPPSLVPFTDLEHELDLNYIFPFDNCHVENDLQKDNAFWTTVSLIIFLFYFILV